MHKQNTILKIIVADATNQFAKELAAEMQDHAEIKYLGTGTALCEELAKNDHYDAVIMDLSLAHTDACSVLLWYQKRLQTNVDHFLCLSAVHSDKLLAYLTTHGCDLYFSKPIEVKSFAKLIYNIAATGKVNIGASILYSKAEVATLHVVTKLLCELGFKPRYTGFDNLRLAIMTSLYDRELTYVQSKGLYTEVARRNHTTSEAVERSIRFHWNKVRDSAKYRNYLKNHPDSYYVDMDENPAPGDFIAYTVMQLNEDYRIRNSFQVQ